MGALFIFIFISILVISALLFFNKGEKAQEIKSLLKDIYENIKELFSNLKKLFLILKEIIQARLDTEPTQSLDKSTSNDSPKSESLKESSSLLSKGVEPPSDNSNDDSNQSNTEVLSETKIDSDSNAAQTSDNSNDDLDKKN